MVSISLTLNALPYWPHTAWAGCAEERIVFGCPFVVTCLYDIMGNGLSLFRLQERQFICTRFSLKSSVYFQYCHIGSRESIFTNHNHFKKNTNFYFNFIALCVVSLINKFAHISLLASSSAYTLYYLFASPYKLVFSSFEKTRFEVKRSRSLICTLFSKMISWGNDAYL